MKKPLHLLPFRRGRIGVALCFGLVAVTCFCNSSRDLSAAEPAREFLNALRDRGYHDIALEYLEIMATSPLAPVDLKEVIQYEKGVTLIESSRTQRDPAIREKLLDDAQTLLKDFTENPRTAEHVLANAARNQLGNVIIGRAQMLVDRSKQGNEQALLKEAYQRYEEAYKVFTELEEAVRVQLLRIPSVLDLNDKRQAQMAERRNQLRQDYLQAWLTAEAIREEMAGTVPEGSETFKKLLTDAATRYEELYTKYRLKMAGLYARMFQGRVNQRLGKLQDALGYYTELLDQPDEPDEFRLLKTRTLRLALEAWLHPSEKKYLEAIKRGSEWVKKSRPTDDRDPDWLAIRLSLAKAYKMQADEAEPGDDRTVNQATSEARKQANFVASKRSEFQEEARQLVAALGGPDRTGEKPDPRTFKEAMDAGREALAAGESAEVIVKKVPERIRQEADAAVKADLEKQLDEARQTLHSARAEAMNYFQLALTLADHETSTDDVNAVRYYMCYLEFRKPDYYKAALLGDFVSRRYPDSAGGRPCAEIAMASYNHLLNESSQVAEALFKELDQDQDGVIAGGELESFSQLFSGADGDADGTVTQDEFSSRLSRFELTHLVAVAEYITVKWPDQPVAETALTRLVPLMISEGELARAEEFLARIPESSSTRGKLELSTGLAVWAAYLRESQALNNANGNGTGSGPDQRTKLDQWKENAQRILAAGYARLDSSSKSDRATVTALLSLAQAYLELQQASQAVEVLEHQTHGPLVLANKNDPATQDPLVAEEIYKTALRAYISSLAGAEGSTAIDKAKDVMGKMKEALTKNEGGEQRLVSVYVNLARDLEKQLESAPPDVKLALSQGFEAFLRQLNQESSELSVLNWVAESFAKLGNSLNSGPQLNEDAKKYYQASLDAFQHILDKVELTPTMKVQVQMRMSGVQGEMGDFEKAVGMFEEILAANANALNVQVEAVKLIELWAKQPGQQERYKDAIVGTRKPGNSQPVIWGWGGISQKTAGNPKFKDTFYEARLHLAQCRYDHAMAKQGDERQKLLKSAKQDISITKRLYPELGGKQLIPQYDNLLKKIQNALGEQPVGLPAL